MKAFKTLTYPEDPIGDAVRLFPARIMTPSDVTAAVQNQPLPALAQLKNRWMFCGDVDSETFRLMAATKERELAFRSSAFRAKSGSAYCVLTHQVYSHQHRFLLPVWDDRVRTCLAALGREPYGFMLGNDRGSDALVFPGAATTAHCEPLVEMAKEGTTLPMRELAAEMSLAVLTLCALEAIPSVLEGVAVERLSISLVTPPALSDLIMQTVQ